MASRHLGIEAGLDVRAHGVRVIQWIWHGGRIEARHRGRIEVWRRDVEAGAQRSRPRSLGASVLGKLLAYFLKLPGNFGQHNLANGCPHAQTEARYPTRTLHKRPPIRFFRKEMSNSRDRTFCLGISTFFRGVPPKVGAAQRQKKKWRFGSHSRCFQRN